MSLHPNPFGSIKQLRSTEALDDLCTIVVIDSHFSVPIDLKLDVDVFREDYIAVYIEIRPIKSRVSCIPKRAPLTDHRVACEELNPRYTFNLGLSRSEHFSGHKETEPVPSRDELFTKHRLNILSKDPSNIRHRTLPGGNPK